MDNIGDWIYIIALIIAGVTGIFGSGKKKKRPTDVLGQPGYDEEVTPRPTNEKSFWDLFEEELKEDKPVVAPVSHPKEAQIIAKKSQKKHIRQKTKQPVKSNPALEHDMAYYNKMMSSGSAFGDSAEDQNYTFGNESFHNPDELRKAIIYTEILNRKY